MSNYRITIGGSLSAWESRDIKKQLDWFLSDHNIDYVFIQRIKHKS